MLTNNKIKNIIWLYKNEKLSVNIIFNILFKIIIKIFILFFQLVILAIWTILMLSAIMILSIVILNFITGVEIYDQIRLIEIIRTMYWDKDYIVLYNRPVHYYSIVDGSSHGGHSNTGGISSVDSTGAGQSIDIPSSRAGHPPSAVPTNDEASQVSDGGMVRSSSALPAEVRARMVIEQANGDTDTLRGYMELEQQHLGGPNGPNGGHDSESMRYMDLIHNELDRILSPDANSNYSNSSSPVPDRHPAVYTNFDANGHPRRHSMYNHEHNVAPLPVSSSSVPVNMNLAGPESHLNIIASIEDTNIPDQEFQGVKHPRSPSVYSSADEDNKRPRIN